MLNLTRDLKVIITKQGTNMKMEKKIGTVWQPNHGFSPLKQRLS